MTIKSLALCAGAATLALAATAHAATVNVGTLVTSTTQNETLLNGDAFTLATAIYDNAGLYTYQYNLTNVGDPSGISTLTLAVNGASDFGTSGLTFFFGGPTATALGGNVTTLSSIGNDATTTSLAPIVNNTSTAEAFANNTRVDFETVGANAIQQGNSNFSQLGDYFYIQSHSASGTGDINVTDSSSADFQGPVPGAAPEPATIAPFAIGGLGLLALTLRARRSRLAA